MPKTLPALHLSISIQRSFQDVYAFASNPANLPKWAAGLSNGITRQGDEWISESPMGRVKVKFAPANPFGVLDHDVTLPSGQVVHNPLRILPNGTGSEVVFTLFQLDGMSDQEFERDAGMVQSDLKRLKQLLES